MFQSAHRGTGVVSPRALARTKVKASLASETRPSWTGGDAWGKHSDQASEREPRLLEGVPRVRPAHRRRLQRRARTAAAFETKPVIGAEGMRATTDPREPIAPIKTLAALRQAEAECTRCPLYQFATQVVPGEGPSRAPLMLVGEQPGDQEDLAGKPFIGPAGRVLDRALEQAGISRRDVFVTNAVKHFKYEMRGKRRLHKRPNAYEIERCRWWLEQERALVRAAGIVALGATAARSVLGRPVGIAKSRGQAFALADGTMAFVTIHPSYLLRIQDEPDKEREYRNFVSDLRRAVETIANSRPGLNGA
jgi:uracil-DNA glycosylase